MKSRLQYMLAMIMASLLLSSVLVTAQSTVADLPSAEARCLGTSGGTVERYLPLWGGYVLVGREMAQLFAGTCDGDAYYAGAVNDPATDNSCVAAYITDWPWWYVQFWAQECTTGGWTNFSYTDPSDNTSYMDAVPNYISPLPNYEVNYGY